MVFNPNRRKLIEGLPLTVDRTNMVNQTCDSYMKRLHQWYQPSCKNETLSLQWVCPLLVPASKQLMNQYKMVNKWSMMFLVFFKLKQLPWKINECVWIKTLDHFIVTLTPCNETNYCKRLCCLIKVHEWFQNLTHLHQSI